MFYVINSCWIKVNIFIYKCFDFGVCVYGCYEFNSSWMDWKIDGIINVLTPVFKLTSAFGIPVGVWKAGSNLSAICWAFSLNITSPVSAKHDKSPPMKRMFVSNTEISDV